MQRSPSGFPLANYLLFVVLTFAIVVGYSFWMSYTHQPRPQPAQVAEAGKDKKDKKAEPGEKPPAKKPAEKPAEKPLEKPLGKVAEKPPERPAKQPPAKAPPATQAKEPPRWVALGSADATAPYRMLVTLSNQGAALARIELSSSRYHDLDDRGGYLGHVVMEDDSAGNGCPVQVVGAGTPAAKAGLKPGDLITAIGGKPVRKALDLDRALQKTKPRQSVELTILREGKDKKPAEMKLMATLAWRPLEVVRPEWKDPRLLKAGQPLPDAVHLDENSPLSMLATLQQIDADRIPDEETEKEDAKDKEKDKDKENEALLNRELKGIHLRTENWQVAEADQDHVVFRQLLPEYDLELTKTYRLVKIPENKVGDADFPAYHLEFELAVKNNGRQPRKVAYRLDGPNGLPREGWWYANKVSRTWGGAGLRDVLVSFERGDPKQVTCPDIADGKIAAPWQDQALTFIGVDAQYLSAVMVPEDETTADIHQSLPLRVGGVDPERKNTTNISFRIIAKEHTLGPGQQWTDHYELFAGPKRPSLLDQKTYKQQKLNDLLYYGWFGWVAEPMLRVLHMFYYVVRNYGLAIIMLTVLVRLCMFPLSRKQALGAQKMQLLQPEIKKLQEKYKKDMEARTKAQQELFRKHNYNPLSGCLVLFIQLPIFVGLYRSLMVDVELRDAPLLSEAVRWCSNLAAPDMLLDWSGLWSSLHLDFVNRGIGMFGLGPYLNILPVFTIALFIIQQKMFMPPATDEQSAMQQKVMKYMMVFMGILFYKVASGLCLYFIASSLWGLAERKILPKTAAGGADAADAPDSPPGKPRSWPWSSPAARETPAERRKKRNRGKK